jgi:hypothetical protein
VSLTSKQPEYSRPLDNEPNPMFIGNRLYVAARATVKDLSSHLLAVHQMFCVSNIKLKYVSFEAACPNAALFCRPEQFLQSSEREDTFQNS